METSQYRSTRDASHQIDAASAIARGLAPDGGLYIPVEFPRFDLSDFADCKTLADTATVLIQPFVQGSKLENEIADICREAFTFETPLLDLPVDQAEQQVSVLELFHGPTAAFKDVGARFLSACLERTEAGHEGKLKILVATSGDTGGAVAAAFHGRQNVEVDVFYPAGQVSARQEQQLTCWGDNIRAFRVDGRFDDCQALVKAVFQDDELMSKHRFSSANSINLGRLLPQMAYYAYSSVLAHRKTHQAPSFIVPTGNLGNALAAVWARRAGLPINDIVLATNANRSIPDYLDKGDWSPRQSQATLASAMDVGNPSNMERLLTLFPDVDEVRHQVSAYSVTDAQIEQQISKDFEQYKQVWCPHTATGFYVYDHLPLNDKKNRQWIVVATAHPAKFETIVEPLIHAPIEVPKALAKLLDLPSHAIDLSAQLSDLRAYYA